MMFPTGHDRSTAGGTSVGPIWTSRGHRIGTAIVTKPPAWQPYEVPNFHGSQAGGLGTIAIPKRCPPEATLARQDVPGR